MAVRVTGRTKWFNAAKGWGWVRADGDEVTDYFAHYTEIRQATGYKSLAEGEPVEFTPAIKERGPAALDIERTSARIAEPAG